ncbi:MAG TPA: fumarate reductase/succinate dehydrogenase flavoprotein subunit, partial [Ktedonobacter sp.]|nr:fumarate reductase/succinate dehydrogenase flavoprotein subunit [Ktedonobacter sp.]
SGLRAAIAATEQGAKVIVVAKELLRDAHTGWAMGGLNVAMKAPATPQMHFKDTIDGGWFINNYKLVKIFSEEMPERIHDLEQYGVKFDRLPDGSYFTWAGGKHSAPLNLCAGDYTGREMMQGLLAEIDRLAIP